MARLIAAGALAGATIAACFSAPTRPAKDGDGSVDGDGAIDGIRGDARGDGPMPITDGDPNKCLADDFTGSGSGTCGSSMWGNPTTGGSDAAFLSGTGELELTNNGSANGFVNCTSATLPWNRVIVDVEAVAATVTADRTFVGLQSADATMHWGVEFSNSGGTPAFQTVCDEGVAVLPSSTLWNSATQHYIKVERTGPAEISISLSGNATTFPAPIDTCAPQGGVLDTTSTQLRVFRNPTTAGGSATATFRSIELCHD